MVREMSQELIWREKGGITGASPLNRKYLEGFYQPLPPAKQVCLMVLPRVKKRTSLSPSNNSGKILL